MMQLTEFEKDSSTWKKLTGHLDDLLAKSHLKLEKQQGIEETAALRGRIKLIRELQALSKPSAPHGTEMNTDNHELSRNY